MRTIRTVALVVALVACCQLVAQAQCHYHRGTPWSKLRAGMNGYAVGNILGNLTYEFGSRGEWVQAWRYVDWCQGFDQALYFSVRYRYERGRWSAYDKSVSWVTERWFTGSGVYTSYDVSDEWE